jgi:hypothetical protein
MNKEKMTHARFEWASEYYAVSVCESALDDVRGYIDNQEEHRRKKTYVVEVEEFLEKYNFSRLPSEDTKVGHG